MNYRPRLTSIRDVASRETAIPRDANGNIETDLDACRELLFAVLETAIRDLEFINHAETQTLLSASQQKRRDEILEDGDPHQFFASSWFADMCYFLGLDPGSVRDLLARRSPTTVLAQAS